MPFHSTKFCTLDKQGNTCAHFAAKKGDIDMLQLLSDYGANLNIQTEGECQMLPIHWAASEGKINSIKFLLDNRVDVNSQDSAGCSPLIIATQHNMSNCVIFLVKNGADLSLRDNNGDTAAHWAAYKGYVELFSLYVYFMPQCINMDDSFGQVIVTDIFLMFFFVCMCV